jgi:alpha/beta superfamily hydrolase
LKPQSSERLPVEGEAGALEVVVNVPASERGIALIAHPHPLFGGTLDNKVVQTLAKAAYTLGCIAVRMNFRGVGGSAGTHDNGEGETQDWLTVLSAARARFGDLPVLLAGFSFGAFVQSRVAAILVQRQEVPLGLTLIAPAVGRFAVQPAPLDTLVVHGNEDDVVPLADVFAWAKPQQQPLIVLPGAGHFFHGYLPKLQQVVTRYWAASFDGP